MGCTYSVYRKKKSSFPEVVVFVPSTRIPVQSDLQRMVKGVIPRDLADKLTSLRNQIVLIAEDTGVPFAFHLICVVIFILFICFTCFLKYIEDLKHEHHVILIYLNVFTT